MADFDSMHTVIQQGTPIGGLAAQSLAVGVGLFLSRGLGFVRDAVIAYRFGASAQTDAYLIAAQVPLVFDSVLAGSALYSALMPVAATCLVSETPDQRLARLVRNVTTLVLLSSGSVGLLGILFSSWIVSVFSTGFSSEAHEVATSLVALTMLGLPFIGLTNVAWAILNTKGRFWGPAIALSFSNITLITFALVFGPVMGIYALAIGYVVGVVVQVASQYFELHRLQVPIRLGLDMRDRDLLTTLGIFWPLALGGLVSVLSPTIDNFVATFLPSGGVTVIRYAYGLTVPFSILSVAISVPLLTRLSKAVMQKDFVSIADILQKVVRFLSLVLFGVAAWFVVMREPIVSLVYQRGAFDQLAVERTAGALAMYAIAIPFASVYYFLLRALLAFSKSRPILLLGVFGLVLNLVLDLVFLPFLAHSGIALSFAIVQIFYVLLAVMILNRELKEKYFVSRLLSPLFVNGVAAGLGIGLSAFIAGVFSQIIAGYSGIFWIVIQSILMMIFYLSISRALGFCDLSWINVFWNNLIGRGKLGNLWKV